MAAQAFQFFLAAFLHEPSMQTENFIPGKDASLESSIASMTAKLAALDFHIEQRSWLNRVEVQTARNEEIH